MPEKSFFQQLAPLIRLRPQAVWISHAQASALCLLLLTAAWLLEPWSAPFAMILFLLSYSAGLARSLPETAHSIAEGDIDVDFLMILVALGAWLLGHPGEGAMLLVLFSGSRAMEAYARQRTRVSISELTRELPRTVTRVDGDRREEADIEGLAAGDVLEIKPGERFPVDCEFLSGRTTVDLSTITGESEPLVPAAETEIPSGALNGAGLARVEVRRPARESAFQKIISLIENAPARRAPAQVLSDRVGKYFTWVILGGSALGFFLWWMVGGLALQEAGYRAMVLLVAGSPCAIVLSIPSAILAAIARGARGGILFNGGMGLSALADVHAVAFDKTGTLSTGIPGVMKVTGEGAKESACLAVAWELSRSSTHPASRAIARHFRETGAPDSVAGLEDIGEKPGRGMAAQWKGEPVWLGRPRGCDLFDDEEREYSRVVLYVGKRPMLRFYLTETPRVGAAETVEGLRQRGLSSFIISGDGQAAVDRMARTIGIDEARGELSPEDKWRIVREEAQRRGVLMLGDGVNDAPALTEATVAAAMGVRGSAATLAQADIVLVRDSLPDLLTAIDLGRRTRRIIRQNLTIAIGAASILVAFAVAGTLPLALGVFGHEGGTVLVVLNSLRLLLAHGDHPRPAESTTHSLESTPSIPTAV